MKILTKYLGKEWKLKMCTRNARNFRRFAILCYSEVSQDIFTIKYEVTKNQNATDIIFFLSYLFVI